MFTNEPCPPEVRAKLEPKDCPSCGKACVPRKGGFSKLGWFMGCPSWPRCSGKAPVFTLGKRSYSKVKLNHAYAYINRIGGIEEAEKWLRAAAEIIRLSGGKEKS